MTLRIVIDANVLVSAIIDNGKPRQLVIKLLEEHTVVISRQMLAELADVTTRDKFHIKSSQVNRFVASIMSKCKIVVDNSLFKVIVEDPRRRCYSQCSLHWKSRLHSNWRQAPFSFREI